MLSPPPDDALGQPNAIEPKLIRTAAQHLTANVPRAALNASAGDVRRSLIGQRFDSAAEVVVLDQDRLAGLINIEDLLAAEPDVSVKSLMDADPPVVGPHTHQEMAAWTATQRGESSLVVVDDDRGFLGIIPPQCLLQVLLQEHGRDMARLGGFLHDAASARMASEEPVVRRFKHRIPWLLVGLLGAFAAANILSSYEEQLAGRVILAFFVPGIVYLADAVGTQTETLIIRGL
jgi:magnesium transporter